MFKPETEDMLPRMAPKPSGAPMGATELIVRPQVPEVSILFGQQQECNIQAQSQAQNTQQTTSYAAWKKQMLPKVTFPPSLSQEVPSSTINNIQSARNNLYPLRTPTSTAPVVSSVGNTNTYAPSAVSYESPMYAVPSVTYAANGGLVPSNPMAYRPIMENPNNFQPVQQNIYRKSMEMTPPPPISSYSSPRDVLTICAGTQTDAMSSPNSGLQNINQNIATKKDIEEIKLIMQEMRHDQICLMQLMEKLLSSQQFSSKPRVECKDIGIQVNNELKDDLPITSVFVGETGPNPPQLPPTNKIVQQLKPGGNMLQTPKGKPIAQSTTYRPNSPQSNRLQEYQRISSPPTSTADKQSDVNYQQWNNQQIAAALPKPNTEKSLIMNQLALKYLPNEKLAELLNDLNFGNPQSNVQKQMADPSTPLRNIENFERSPADISNASYKYLKKYRLLPEDHIAEVESENPIQNNNTPPKRQYAVLRSPNHQQKPINMPMGRLPQSPLARAETTPVLKDNMVDLENIKYQPKFL
ncbi:anastral spindle 2 [Haematobia irritans]|uniref:anastral spindle 2 n=1 Tax=Haematobia irritans TaxID=7368 RepID=UPI003F4FD796